MLILSIKSLWLSVRCCFTISSILWQKLGSRKVKGLVRSFIPYQQRISQNARNKEYYSPKFYEFLLTVYRTLLISSLLKSTDQYWWKCNSQKIMKMFHTFAQSCCQCCCKCCSCYLFSFYCLLAYVEISTDSCMSMRQHDHFQKWLDPMCLILRWLQWNLSELHVPGSFTDFIHTSWGTTRPDTKHSHR